MLTTIWVMLGGMMDRVGANYYMGHAGGHDIDAGSLA